MREKEVRWGFVLAGFCLGWFGYVTMLIWPGRPDSGRSVTIGWVSMFLMFIVASIAIVVFGIQT